MYKTRLIEIEAVEIFVYKQINNKYLNRAKLYN